MSDTSLVFNLVAKERVSQGLKAAREKFSVAAAGISAGVASALGAGIASNLDVEAASDKLTAQLGVGPAKAAELSKVSARIYAQAWGESAADVNNAVRGVYQNIGNVSGVKGGLEGVTTKVMALADTFEQDLGGTTAAVGQMLKTGLAKDANQALDIITRGFQSGANKADDLLDTVTEYGTQWRKFGLDGKTAMGLLSQGLKAGARDADIVADAIKEFSIRGIDGSKLTAAGFKTLGLNAGAMAKAIGKGGDSATKALDLTLDKLRAIPDPVKRSQTAVALFGTQAEDLGEALYALDPSKAVQSLGKVSGAADRMAKTVGDNPKAALESFKRTAMARLTEVGGGFVQFAMRNQNAIKPLGIALAGIAATVLVVKGAMMAWTAVQAVWTAAMTVATAVQWAWNVAMNANPVGLIILGVIALVAAIVLLWKKNEGFRNFFIAAWAAIKSAMGAVWNFLKMLGSGIASFGVATWNAMKKVGNAFKSAWDTSISWGKKAWNWIASIPGKIGRAFSGIARIVSMPYKMGFNAIARFWNATVGRLRFSVPSWVPGIGGAGFSFPQIPYLAKGGDITRAGIAIVGERGPEALQLPAGARVSPLQRGGSATTRSTTDINYDRLAEANVRAFVRAGITVKVDQRVLGELVSQEVGRTTQLRRRSG